MKDICTEVTTEPTDVTAVPGQSWADLTGIHSDCVQLLGRATIAMNTMAEADLSMAPARSVANRNRVVSRFSSDIATKSAELRVIHESITSHTPGVSGEADTLQGYAIANDLANWQTTFDQLSNAAFSDFQAIISGRVMPTTEGPGVTQIRNYMQLSAANKAAHKTK